MTIEIRQLVIRAVVSDTKQASSAAREEQLVARCVRAVLHQLDRRTER